MSSTIERTHGIVLRITPWSKTSHIVTWQTRDFGRVTTLVKGACRPKSAFLGQYDLFYTCELLFYRREHNEMSILRDCASLNRRDALRGNWRATAVAGYFCDLAARINPATEERNTFFDALDETLTALPTLAHDTLRSTLAWFELYCLRVAGIMPDLTLCPYCLTENVTWHAFSLSEGRFQCEHHPVAEAREGVLKIKPATAQGLRFLATVRDASGVATLFTHFAEKKNIDSEHLLLGILRFLGIFIIFHLETPTDVRRVALGMMTHKACSKTG